MTDLSLKQYLKKINTQRLTLSRLNALCQSPHMRPVDFTNRDRAARRLSETLDKRWW